MIYKSNYFNKELRQAQLEDNVSNKSKLAFGLFLGLVSFAVYFMLLMLEESVLFDTIPEAMQASFFSTVYIYIHVAVLLNALYFIVYYDSLFFFEIRRNSWYLLIKMGYNPALMIFAKFAAILFSVIFMYTVGFFFVIFLTFFLRYNLILSYFPTLYIAGLVDLIVISIISMMLSLFIKTIVNARYLIMFSAASLMVLKVKTDYYSILSNRVTMQNVYNLLDLERSSFLLVAAAVILISVIVCIIKARDVSKYYNFPGSAFADVELDAGTPIVYIDAKTGRQKLLDNRKSIMRRRKVLDVAITVSLVLFIVAALSFNAMVLLISATTYGKEISIYGTIPYVFKSNTMEPAIMRNDLAYFKRVADNDSIDIGQIVLFEEKSITYVERVIAKSNGILQVDIDNYPPMSEVGAMKKSIEQTSVHGVYYDRNRWLGALILFANTIVGRLLFLMIPAVLLFFYKPITSKLFQAKGTSLTP